MALSDEEFESFLMQKGLADELKCTSDEILDFFGLPSVVFFAEDGLEFMYGFEPDESSKRSDVHYISEISFFFKNNQLVYSPAYRMDNSLGGRMLDLFF